MSPTQVGYKLIVYQELAGSFVTALDQSGPLAMWQMQSVSSCCGLWAVAWAVAELEVHGGKTIAGNSGSRTRAQQGNLNLLMSTQFNARCREGFPMFIQSLSHGRWSIASIVYSIFHVTFT